MDAQKLTLAILKGIAYTENGGNVSLGNIRAGKSGELKSILQFEPATWKSDAKKVTGNAELELTPANEMLVAHGIILPKVQKAIEDGKDPQTIAKEVGSDWNSGNPNAYKENVRGTNKEGVSYDTPAYADKVARYATKFLADIDGGQEVPDTHATNVDSGHATAVATKFLKSIQDGQSVEKPTKIPSIQLAATAPLPQNNNAGLIPRDQIAGTSPGLIS